jgi:hypothetical protein
VNEKFIQNFGWKARREERPLRIPRHGWEDNIKTDLRKIGLKEWIKFTWVRIEASGWLL